MFVKVFKKFLNQLEKLKSVNIIAIKNQLRVSVLKKKFIAVELICDVVLVSGVQPHEPVVHVHISILFRFFSHTGHCGH